VTFLSAGLPSDLPLGTLALQTGTTGWQGTTFANAPDSNADIIQVWSGASWLNFYYDTANSRWQQDNDTNQTNRNSFVVPAGRPIMVRRLTAPVTAADSLVVLPPLPYVLPP